MVRYTDYTVTVERVADGRILHKFENVRVLQTYNQFERFVTYQKTAGSRFFPGFGKLRIGYGIVQYTQSDINPQVSEYSYMANFQFSYMYIYIYI